MAKLLLLAKIAYSRWKRKVELAQIRLAGARNAVDFITLLAGFTIGSLCEQ